MAKKEVKSIKKKSHYFKDLKAELKKVIWPTRKQLINNTAAVILFTLTIAVIVFVLDFCFESITEYGIAPLQEKIQSSYSSSNNTVDENSGNEETTEVEDQNNVNNVEYENVVDSTNSSNENSEVEVKTNSEE